MKKKLTILLVVTLAFAFVLVGCGGNKAEEDIRAAADGFLSALDQGDLDKAAEYADDSLFDEGAMSNVGEAMNLDDTFYSTLGINSDDLTEENIETLDEFIKTLTSELVKSYEIKDVSEKDGVGTVTVDLTYGFDPAASDTFDATDEMSKTLEKYSEKHLDELREIYDKDGEKGVTKSIVRGALPEILKVIQDSILSSGESSETVKFTVENKNDKWLLTKAEVEE